MVRKSTDTAGGAGDVEERGGRGRGGGSRGGEDMVRRDGNILERGRVGTW